MGDGAVAQLPQGGVLSGSRGGAAAGAGPDARRTAVGAMLALQRAAGNRAAAAAVRGRRDAGAVGPRSVARCAGACECGGACKKRGQDEELLDETGRRLHRAAADRRAGASSGRVVARSPLTSPRFSGEPLLQDCADDKARMGVGRRDDAAHQPVSKVQKALLDWAATKHVTLDLGTTGPGHDGVDGVYGAKTVAAVRLFKATEHLGFEDFGDVGPGTMNRLNDLFPAAPTPPPPPPTPPTPPAPPISPDDQKQKDAFDDRRKQLRQVEQKLGEMIGAVIRSALVRPGEGPVATVSESFPREVCIVRFFTGATPHDGDYLETLQRAKELVHKDLTDPVQPLTFRSQTSGFCDPGPQNNWAATCSPKTRGCTPKGTHLCDPKWYDSDRHCRSDVLIHETYHWLELPRDGKDFPAPGHRTPAEAFSNADTMTQLGNALIGLSIDNCLPTDRRATVFPNEMTTCLAAPPAP